QREGARPERTVYRITDAGREELVDWTRELVAMQQPEHPRFKAGLSVLAVLPPDEAASALRERLQAVQRALATQRTAPAPPAAEVARLFRVEEEYELALREAEAAWVRALLDELDSGTFPGLAGWRQWHATGEIPPEVAELAERGTKP